MRFQLSSVKLLSLSAVLSFCFFAVMTSTSQAADAQTSAVAESNSKNEFSDFASLRTELLSRMGGASTRVWIVTDFFSDAETVSSLYIAQYRKVNVQVLLGKERASNILSRLSYLKQVNIPVSLRPKGFFASSPTYILTDDKLLAVNSNLDNYTKLKKYIIREESTPPVSDFVAAFERAAAVQNAPNATPLPQVGTPHSSSRNKQWTSKPKQTVNPSAGNPISTAEPVGNSDANVEKTAEAPPVNSAPTGTISPDGSYRYRSIKDAPKSGIATKLPRTTITQDREKARNKSDSSSSPTTNSP